MVVKGERGQKPLKYKVFQALSVVVKSGSNRKEEQNMPITPNEDLLHETTEAWQKARWICRKMTDHYPARSQEARLARQLSLAADKLYYHFLLEVTYDDE